MIRAVSAQSLSKISPNETISMIHANIQDIKSLGDRNILIKYINEQIEQILTAIYHLYAKQDYNNVLNMCEFLLNSKEFALANDFDQIKLNLLYIKGCAFLNKRDYTNSYNVFLQCESSSSSHEFISLSRLSRSYCLAFQLRAEQSLSISTPLISIPNIQFEAKDLMSLANLLLNKLDNAEKLLEEHVNESFPLNIKSTCNIPPIKPIRPPLPKPKSSKAITELYLASIRPVMYSV